MWEHGFHHQTIALLKIISQDLKQANVPLKKSRMTDRNSKGVAVPNMNLSPMRKALLVESQPVLQMLKDTAVKQHGYTDRDYWRRNTETKGAYLQSGEGFPLASQSGENACIFHVAVVTVCILVVLFSCFTVNILMYFQLSFSQ